MSKRKQDSEIEVLYYTADEHGELKLTVGTTHLRRREQRKAKEPQRRKKAS